MSRYVRFVLSPKINALSTELTNLGVGTAEHFSWQSIQYPDWLRGALKWDEYHFRINHRRGVVLFALIGLMSYGFTSIPSIIMIALFFNAKSPTVFWYGWTEIEQITANFVAFGILVILITATVANAESLTSRGIRQ